MVDNEEHNMHESILDNNVAMMVATVADRHDTVDD